MYFTKLRDGKTVYYFKGNVNIDLGNQNEMRMKAVAIIQDGKVVKCRSFQVTTIEDLLEKLLEYDEKAQAQVQVPAWRNSADSFILCGNDTVPVPVPK